VKDLQGRIILEKECNGKIAYEIDLSFAPDGCYIIMIRTDNDLLIRKLTIIK